jgi:hypothetical protein
MFFADGATGITLSAWFFYAGNVFVIAGYIIVGIMLARPQGLTGNADGLSRSALVCLEFYLASCTVLHVELAIRSFQDKPLVENFDGNVDPRITLIIMFKVALWFAFFLVAAKLPRRRAREGVTDKGGK